MTDVRARPAEGGATPGQVVLSFVREKAEPAMESKPVSSAPLCSLFRFLSPKVLIELLPWLPSMVGHHLLAEANPFLPRLLSVTTESNPEQGMLSTITAEILEAMTDAV